MVQGEANCRMCSLGSPGQQLFLPGEALALHSSGRGELSAFPAQALLALTELSGGAGKVNLLGFVLQELCVTSAFCALSKVHFVH